METLTAEPYVGMPVYLDDSFFEYAEAVETAGQHLVESCYPECTLKPDWNTKPETSVKPDMNVKPNQDKTDCARGCPLAMAYVPWQTWDATYSIEEGFKAGTMFPSLDLPFKGGTRK